MAQMTFRSRCHGTNLACSGSEDSETEFGVRLQPFPYTAAAIFL